MALRALQDDAVRGAGHDSQLATVLDRGGNTEVVFSAPPEEPLEPVAVGRIRLGQERGHVDQRHAACGARGRHIGLDEEVHLLVELSRSRRLIEDGVAGAGLGRTDLLVGARHPVDGHPQERVRHRVLDAPALQVRRPPVADRLAVVLCGEHSPHSCARRRPARLQLATGRARGAPDFDLSRTLPLVPASSPRMTSAPYPTDPPEHQANRRRPGAGRTPGKALHTGDGLIRPVKSVDGRAWRTSRAWPGSSARLVQAVEVLVDLGRRHQSPPRSSRSSSKTAHLDQSPGAAVLGRPGHHHVRPAPFARALLQGGRELLCSASSPLLLSGATTWRRLRH